MVVMATTKALPTGLRVITEKLKFPIKRLHKEGRFETYEVDLSEWNLSLTNANPCIWVQKSDLEVLSAVELGISLRDVVREHSWQNSTVLLFIDGDAAPLLVHLPAALPTFISIDENQQAQLQAADSPTVMMLDILLRQMTRLQLAPYETSKPVVGSQFFGRRAEINKVLQHPFTNYLLIGIRRIGKTSLLKEIKQQMDRTDPPGDNQIRRLYVDCTVISSEEEFLRTLTYQLDPGELKLLMGRAAQSKRYQGMMFDRFSSLHGEPVTFLIDELDPFLTHLNDDWRLFDVLQAATTAGKARFIMAGFRQAMKAAANHQLPFFNTASIIHLGRLKHSDARQMVLEPMEQLRIHIQDRESLVNRIYRETAGLPNYIQFYCKVLLERLDEMGRDTLTEDDLQVVYENREFRNFVLDAFMSNTEPLEQALVYALVAEDECPPQPGSFSQRAIDEFLKKRKLSLTLKQLNQTCNNLEIAGIFNQVGKEFEFAVPLFRDILRQTRDVDFLFDKVREEVLVEKIVL